jgi:hypothetical protein
MTNANKRLNEKEAAEFLDVSPGTLSVWRCLGRYDIPFYRIGRNIRYDLDDLRAFVESRKVGRGAHQEAG